MVTRPLLAIGYTALKWQTPDINMPGLAQTSLPFHLFTPTSRENTFPVNPTVKLAVTITVTFLIHFIVI